VLLDRGWCDSEPAVTVTETAITATDSSGSTAQPVLVEQCSPTHDTDVDSSSGTSGDGNDAAVTPKQWDCQWSGARAAVEVLRFTKRLAPWQRVNHFRNSKELCRKDLMLKNIKESYLYVHCCVAHTRADTVTPHLPQ
jgi:hypothetical protein